MLNDYDSPDVDAKAIGIAIATRSSSIELTERTRTGTSTGTSTSSTSHHHQKDRELELSSSSFSFSSSSISPLALSPRRNASATVSSSAVSNGSSSNDINSNNNNLRSLFSRGKIASRWSSTSSCSPFLRKPLYVVYQQQQHQQHDQRQHDHQQHDDAAATRECQSLTSSAHYAASSSTATNKAATAASDNTPTTIPTPTTTAGSSSLIVQRHLTLWDLIGIGVGGTIGSGIFVLTGQIASQYAGPFTFVSFLLAGAAACCSALCYAELSSRIPSPGSSYVYAYVCWGEVAAVVAASCLTLEYGVAGAAVARSWGDKVLLFWGDHDETENNNNSDKDSYFFNFPACMVSLVATILLLAGVQESKHVTNFMTTLKMALVLFMILGGFCLFQPSNLLQFSSSSSSSSSSAPRYGVSGVLRGATSSFFGYLGYDEVCCVAGEALHPARDMPRAVLGTVAIVTVAYVTAAIALTGMLPSHQISPTSGFPDAFAQRGIHWAAQLTAIGELVTLPVVVLISLMAQPRLTLSMAQDGLLPWPHLFAQLDRRGNLFHGTLIAGSIMTVIATFVPFAHLDDLISAGILVAFTMTNSCLVLLRLDSPAVLQLESYLAAFNAGCFLTAILWKRLNVDVGADEDSSESVSSSLSWWWWVDRTITCCSALITSGIFVLLVKTCPNSKQFGGSILLEGTESSPPGPVPYSSASPSPTATTTTSSLSSSSSSSTLFFSTPCVPFVPCLGMAVNWYLIAQLEPRGIMGLGLYVGLTVALYWMACAKNSVGHRFHWSQRQQQQQQQQHANNGRGDISLAVLDSSRLSHVSHHSRLATKTARLTPHISDDDDDHDCNDADADDMHEFEHNVHGLDEDRVPLSTLNYL